MINQYIRKHQLPVGIQLKIRRFLNYMQDNNQHEVDEKDILTMLSGPLKNEIHEFNNSMIIKTCVLFTKVFRTNFLAHISNKLEHRTFAPDDLVIEEGNYARNLYFIVAGKVRFCHLQT
jgi:vesicle coat complex subunit